MGTPKVLYKYYDFEGARKTLEGKSILYSYPDNVNDPFEFCPVKRDFVQDPDFANYMIERLTRLEQNPLIFWLISKLKNPSSKAWLLEELKKEPLMSTDRFNDFGKTMGMTCFSEINDSLLMWAHYANKHRGVCFAFNDCPIDFQQVKYSSERIMVTAKSPVEDYANVLLTKSSEWSYEQEWRSICDTKIHNDIEVLDGKMFLPIKLEWISAVYFGINIAPQNKEILKKLLPTHILCYQAKRDSDKFKIDFMDD